MNEQLPLFDEPDDVGDLARLLCDEFNKLDTCWKGTFRIMETELARWDHISDPNKVLSILITADDAHAKPFMYLDGDEESQEKVLSIRDYSPLIDRLMKDKDFSYCPGPWFLSFYWHKFERKKRTW